MTRTTGGRWWKAARGGAAAAIVITTAACQQSPPLQPSPTPTPTSSPFPSSLNTVFLAAPAVPPGPATNALTGRYRLAIDAGARSGQRCDLVPAYTHHREYTADIENLGGHYAVKLFDATFLADSARVGYGCRDPRLPEAGLAACHQFLLTGDAGALTLTAEAQDEWRGTEIWEGLPDGFVLQIIGRAAGAVRDGRIEATGAGYLWYGNGLPASTSYSCQSEALRFTFSPR